MQGEYILKICIVTFLLYTIFEKNSDIRVSNLFGNFTPLDSVWGIMIK